MSRFQPRSRLSSGRRAPRARAFIPAGGVLLVLALAWVTGTAGTVSTTHLGSASYFDLSGSWNVSKNFTVNAAVLNLFDTDPVMMADQAWTNNTDENLYDVFGRSYYLRLSTRF